MMCTHFETNARTHTHRRLALGQAVRPCSYTYTYVLNVPCVRCALLVCTPVNCAFFLHKKQHFLFTNKKFKYFLWYLIILVLLLYAIFYMSTKLKMSFKETVNWFTLWNICSVTASTQQTQDVEPMLVQCWTKKQTQRVSGRCTTPTPPPQHQKYLSFLHAD